MKQEAQKFIDDGFDPTERIELLEQYYEQAEKSEAKQLKAHAAYIESTQQSVADLKRAYDFAAQTVNLFAGILGKRHEIVRIIHKIRPG